MSLLHADAPWGLALFGWLIAIAAIAQAVREVRHGFLPAGMAQHGWLAAIVTVALLWALHVRSPVGLDFGLLGSALFALVFGRARAVLGLMAALLLYTALDGGSWFNIGINGLVLAVIPAWLASTLQRQIELRLPRNLFVFIIGNGLFVTLFVDRVHERADPVALRRRVRRSTADAGRPPGVFAAARLGRGAAVGDAVLGPGRVHTPGRSDVPPGPLPAAAPPQPLTDSRAARAVSARCYPA